MQQRSFAGKRERNVFSVRLQIKTSSGGRTNWDQSQMHEDWALLRILPLIVILPPIKSSLVPNFFAMNRKSTPRWAAKVVSLQHSSG
jgi:hypothetical protein